jgi:amino acid permease
MTTAPMPETSILSPASALDASETVQLVEYDSVKDATPSLSELPQYDTTQISLSTPEEHQSVEILLKDHHAQFNPKCLFQLEAWGTGTASIANEITNLVKNIVGSGGLSLPAAIATFGNSPSALLPTIVVIFVMGFINAYSFSLLGRVCAVTKSKTYSMAWDRTVGRRHGSKFSVWVNIVVAGKSILGTWSFSIVIASTCQPLVQWMGVEDLTRYQVLLSITGFVLLPLCFFERLEHLVCFSMIGQVGIIWTICTMVVRCFDGSYREGGKFFVDLEEGFVPKFGNKGALSFFSPQSLVLVSILSTGFVAHYNAPRYYFELKDHTTGRFNIVVNFSFILAAIVYVAVSSLGFLTFGENSKGFILDNYSYRDPLASIARVGVATSVIFAYPLLFHGGRDSFLALVGRDDTSLWIVRVVSVLMLSVVTTLAICVSDLTFVLSISGSTMSALLIYIFPPLMFDALVKNCTCIHTFRTNLEVKESIAMIWFGGTVGVLGAIVTTLRTFF